MASIRAMVEGFFTDFLRIYRILPHQLRRRTLRVFGYIIVLALLEVVMMFAISFLAVSIAAPEKLQTLAPVVRFFQLFPFLQPLSQNPREFALFVAVAVVSLVLCKNAMSAFVTYQTVILGERIALFAGEIIFRSYLYSSYSEHLSGDSQRMFQSLSWRGMLGTITTNFLTIYTYAAITIALVTSLLSAMPGLIVPAILLLALLSFGIYNSLKGHIEKAGASAAELGRNENQTTLSAMRGIREVLIYRQQPVFFESYRTAALKGMPYKAFLAMAPPIPTWVMESIGFMVIPATLWILYAFRDATMGLITAVLTMIMLICWRVLPMLNRTLSTIIAVRGMRHAALDCLARVEVELARSVVEPPEPDPNFVLSNSIAFKNVTFRYPNAQTDSLRDMSFTIPVGKRVGLIGQSGAGKSSIVNICCGLLEPTSGDILVDGRKLTLSELAAFALRVGYVPQTPNLMVGTIASNVAFSQWGKPWDEERVRQACRMAALDVAETRGLGMGIGENGAGLSGGQAQRLSLARALYAGPSVLILDEATSALDTGLETSIMNTIFSLPQTMTMIIVAHRLSTVERCDLLLWVEAGELVTCGTPEEILPRYNAFLVKNSDRAPSANVAPAIQARE